MHLVYVMRHMLLIAPTHTHTHTERDGDPLRRRELTQATLFIGPFFFMEELAGAAWRKEFWNSAGQMRMKVRFRSKTVD